MKKNTYPLYCLAIFAGASSVAFAETIEEKIERALSAAPPAVSDNATVMDSDGTVLKEGTNGWTCLPDTLPGDKAPMCNDAVWMEMLAAVGNQADFSTSKIGISYMLQGEPSGSGVSNSTPYHADHVSADDYVETGPHIMIVVPKSMLSGITTDPSEGGPYVMWGDTPYAHIMIPVSIDGKQVLTKQE
ncbi:hypothetical protein DXV75_04380 [Alteromonas aestuariivivens]|uniref:Uncharacterized protein n=1 Tax=Alteromonas aestuariivivens TaxID=1938339 RepID=A0A3D8MD85_9ALTE|nr:hypothetical protein [Alteromonas aestuariivivens]RDV28199.1 hypothetical protein DXV75_04380 [Alteromonas aestuariivivens]